MAAELCSISMSLALVLAASGCGDGAREPSAEVPVRLADLALVEKAVAEQRGHGLLVNFWATWCPPCVAELPDLVDVARDSEARGGRVLGISFDLLIPDVARDEGLQLVVDYLKEQDLALPTLVYDAHDFDAINARFELPGPIPVTLAYDRDGRIVDRHAGEADRERFVEMMQKALGR